MANNNSYLLPVEETARAAWEKVSGSKGSFWAAILISILIGIGMGVLEGVAKSLAGFLGGIVNIASSIINFLIAIGLLYMGILRAKNAPISYKQMFMAFNRPYALKAIGLFIIDILIFFALGLFFIFVPMGIFGTEIGDTLSTGFSVGNFLLASWILIGILVSFYISIRMLFSMAFIVDKNLGPWDSIKMSFKITRHNFFRVVGIVIIQVLAIIIGTLLLGIGLIWALPFAYILFGLTYKNLLGPR